ncbi:signal peptidase I [Nitrincola tapanii]|uniref:Signal peptidase I n=1 Tax=Nitrincola tapanii TaxID=1708751 RepID=A0A5A9W001_9GAMM|nr:signal peptidase I [Nitrincola tapanii]KAA0873824.1 signal peptidase I [Nitrincola tapanii]
MDFDFSLILVLATLVTGVLWGVDHLFFRPGRLNKLEQAQAQTQEPLTEPVKEALLRQPGWADVSRSMFPVLAVVLVLRSFVFEPFQIPSGSMLPTLQIGDFILVNKYHYGLRLPVTHTKILSLNEPERGEVAVFRYPQQPSINYIKRVIGLPGDVISYHNKTLFVNGEAVPAALISGLPPHSPEVLLLSETLGEHRYQVYQDLGRPAMSAQWVVPEGHYFFVGDNRDNSNDSRYWGYVSEQLLVGKAVAVWMHWDNFFSLPDFSIIRWIK